MSTTRWIIETPCEHGSLQRHATSKERTKVTEGEMKGYLVVPTCDGGSRVVVDPDNLPPEAIERAAQAMFGCDPPLEPPFYGMDKMAEAAVRAFLSDPEPGDQT